MYYYGIISVGILAVLLVLGIGKNTLAELGLTSITALFLLLITVVVSMIKPIVYQNTEFGFAGLVFLLLAAVFLFWGFDAKITFLGMLGIFVITALVVALRLYAGGFLALTHGELIIPFVAGTTAFIFARDPKRGFVLCVLPHFFADLALFFLPNADEGILSVGARVQFDDMLTSLCVFFVIYILVDFIQSKIVKKRLLQNTA